MSVCLFPHVLEVNWIWSSKLTYSVILPVICRDTYVPGSFVLSAVMLLDSIGQHGGSSGFRQHVVSSRLYNGLDTAPRSLYAPLRALTDFRKSATPQPINPRSLLDATASSKCVCCSMRLFRLLLGAVFSPLITACLSREFLRLFFGISSARYPMTFAFFLSEGSTTWLAFT